jgi:hypothetical protein
VPATVDQIGDGTWALFPAAIFLKGGETYTARIDANVCGFEGNCTRQPLEWRFTTAVEDLRGHGDTRVARGFPPARPSPSSPPEVAAVRAAGPESVVVTFSRPVMNVNSMTLSLAEGGCAGQALPGELSSSPAGDVWTYRPESPLRAGASYCVRVTNHIYDLEGQGLARPVQVAVVPPAGRSSSHN